MPRAAGEVRHHLKNCEKLLSEDIKRKGSNMGEDMLMQGAEGTEEVQAASTEEQAGAQGEANTEGQEQPEKKYTDADVDRIVAKKIAAERKRMQKLFEGEQQESELEIRERNILKREMKADAKDKLIEGNYPSGLADILDYTDKEAFEKSYEAVTKIFNESMQQAFKERLRGKAPKVSTHYGGPSERIADAFAPPRR